MDNNKDKFLFHLNDFSDEKPVNAEEEEKTFSEDELNQAREESFKLGTQDATQKIRGEHEERLVQCTETLTQHLSELLGAEARRDIEKSVDTARLTLSIVKKMMPNLSSKFAEDEIIALVKQALSDRPDEPRLVVVVHDEMLEPLRQKIDDITNSQAFQGKVVIIADDTIALTDCRVEWADGGIEKDFKVLYAAIEKSFNSVLQRLSTDGNPVEDPHTPPAHEETEPTLQNPEEDQT